MRNLLVHLCLSITLLSAVNVNSGIKSNSMPGDKVPTKHTVSISGMKYSPADLVVNKGDTVVWINKDFVVHDVTDEKEKKWTSGKLDRDESWSKVIVKDEQYFCSIHVVMKGTIKVE